LKASGVIYRLGRVPDPWAVPDWASAGPDGTFGNRFDDPDATYRVLYASSQRLGCFLETLARFRIDPKLAAELAQLREKTISFDSEKYLWNGSRGESWGLPVIRPNSSRI
jgi:RES domain